MIPDNPNIFSVTESTKFLRGQFQYPNNISAIDELTDYELGGIAIQDPSRGLRYQMWNGYWNSSDSTAYVIPDDAEIPTALFTQSGVLEFTFTFDQNMRWSTACRFAGNTIEHRWYDAAVEAYVTTTYTGINSVRLTLDDKRDMQIQLGAPDMILTYVRANQVRWRIQRDRFLVEYTYAGLTVPSSYRITNFGMNTKNRLQWRIGPRRT